MAESAGGAGRPGRLGFAVVGAVYALFFFSGATALIFEVLWTTQFVTVFGNSSYATSCVLAAFMGGVGLGALWFGRVADRRPDRLALFALIEAGVVVSALLVPQLVRCLLWAMPAVFARVQGLGGLTVIRFVFSFAVLLVPSFLMGGTLPVLSRFVVERSDMVGARVSLLYGLNTLGAAVGCFAAGFYLIETIGLSKTNLVAAGINALIIAAVLVLRKATIGQVAPQSQTSQDEAAGEGRGEEPAEGGGRLLVFAAFMSGFAVMSLEVLWIRYLVFTIANNQYSFTAILGVLLGGLAAGSLFYRLFLARRRGQMAWLGVIELLVGPVVLGGLLLGAGVVTGGYRPSVITRFAGEAVSSLKPYSVLLVMVTIGVPTVVMGLVFPLVSAAYARSVKTVGRRLGRIYAVNTLGSIAGSLAPMLFMVTAFQIQKSIYAVVIATSVLGVVLLWAGSGGMKRILAPVAAVGAAALFVAFFHYFPENLTQKVFFANPLHRGGHHEVEFYREGRTATVLTVKDKVNGFKEIYIGGVEEVPTTYVGRLFFKLFGTVGPLLCDEPDDTLVLCMGGGVTAGTIARHPQVKRVVCVDLVKDMEEAARRFGEYNNNVVDDPKFEFVHQDARNFLLTCGRRWPLIVCDSTHPKAPESWVLYTKEFYEAAAGALDEDGIFMQWAPVHTLSLEEYKILLATFQSVFPHTSVWLVAGYPETAGGWITTFLVGTPGELKIDVAKVRERLSVGEVKADLEEWDLGDPLGVLEMFLCGEKKAREWTAGAPVNTDDLPYTQYDTRYAAAGPCGWEPFGEVAESVWPYLVDTGDSAESVALRRDLERHLAGRSRFLVGRLDEALVLVPGSAKLHRNAENLKVSRRYLQKLTAYYGDDGEMLSWIAAKYRMMLDHDASADRRDYEEAAAIYDEALSVDPGNAATRVDYGTMLAFMGRMQGAVEQLMAAVSLDGSNAQARHRLGSFLAQRGRPQEALEQLEKAAQLAPGNADVEDNLGALLARMGEADEALAHFAKAVRARGDDARIRYNYGCALAQAGRGEEAIEQFDEAIALDATPAEPYYSKGVTLELFGRLDEAASYFRKVLALDASNARAHDHLGMVLVKAGRADEAIGHLREAAGLDPSVPGAFEKLAGTLSTQGRYADAAEALREGLEKAPSDSLQNSLAWLLATCPEGAVRNGAEAVALAEEVNRATGYDKPEALDALAAAYAETGKFDQAAGAAERALELARSRGQEDLARGIEKRLELYRAGKAYREPEAAP